MREKVLQIASWLMDISFYLLFFLIPIILTPFNYELFEFNKMLTVYALSAAIGGLWIIKMILNRKIFIRRTPFDLPIFLFLASQIVSTFFSMDRHVSVWGYYSRFNGGLLSTISYILLYFAFVSNFPREKVLSILKFSLVSATLVAFYGILEHLGVDKNLWVQDVQNRVFSTLGQPNWLAAYLAVLLPIVSGLTVQKLYQGTEKPENKTQNFGVLIYLVASSIFYATLLFTKSRSGFLGFWIADISLWLLLFWQLKSNVFRSFIFLHVAFIILTFFLGAPLPQVNRFTLKELFRQNTQEEVQVLSKPAGSSVIEVGITESGTIRRIVWKGAWEIFRHHPLFGTGVETFAFSYYLYRPVEHNMTSEWDFLYNKAHNEYLNMAATTGMFGLGSYLFFITSYILWNVKKIWHSNFLLMGIFAGWLSILITNFFGFSVVVIQLFFYLLPSVSVLLAHDELSSQNTQSKSSYTKSGTSDPSASVSIILMLACVIVLFYVLSTIVRIWFADMQFATGFHASRAQKYVPAYQSIKEAIALNSHEPLYYDELSFPAAQIAAALLEDKQTTASSQLMEEAVTASNISVTTSPNNVNFWKTRTRMYYVLASLDEKYLSDAYAALEKAKQLSPTDPKVRYNIALLLDRLGKKKEAVDELVETTKLKPDYRDAYYALAYIYDQLHQRDKAKEALEFIVTHIATDDADAKKKLQEWK